MKDREVFKNFHSSGIEDGHALVFVSANKDKTYRLESKDHRKYEHSSICTHKKKKLGKGNVCNVY